jgi:hypothetical protein
MRRTLAMLILLLLLAPLLLAPLARAQAPTSPYREVEVCFVLDTTGSMGGLLQAAKDKIWFIANQIVAAPSKPKVRFCLLGFRDRDDEYVTRRFDLTDDMDGIYKALLGFNADGGGDTPEAVNQALLEAVEKPGWSTHADVLRLIFLVGDAPPKHYDDEPQYAQIAALAKARGILINPVQCGVDDETGRAWSAIARLGGGETAQITDAGAVRRVRTPVDQDLAALNKRLGLTLVPYGDAAAAASTTDAQALAERMDDAGVSDRLAFKLSSGTLAASDDLVERIASGSITPADIDRDKLPERFRSMTESELLAQLHTLRDERAELSRVIGSLVAQREAWLDAQGGAGAGFDQVVAATIRRQLAGPVATR